MVNYRCQVCGEPALYYCQCEEEYQFICHDHIPVHLQRPGRHGLNAIFRELTATQKQEVGQTKELLEKALQKTLTNELQSMNQTLNCLLSQIQLVQQCCSQSIKMITKEYDQRIHELNEILNSGYNYLQSGGSQEP